MCADEEVDRLNKEGGNKVQERMHSDPFQRETVQVEPETHVGSTLLCFCVSILKQTWFLHLSITANSSSFLQSH